MKYEIPLEYVAYLAFSFLLEAENKKELEINKLLEYRNLLIKKANELYLEDPSWYDPDNELILINNKLNFKPINLINIKEFVEDNQDLFHFERKTITLKDNITTEELENIRNTYELENYNITALLLDAYYCKESLDVLPLNKFKRDLVGFIEHEQEIENLYKILDSNINDINQINNIKIRQYISNIKYNKIANYTKEYYTIYWCSLQEQIKKPLPLFDEKILKDTNIYKEIMNYQKISLKNDFTINAILTDNTIAPHKILCQLDRMIEKNIEFENEESMEEEFSFSEVEWESSDDFLEKIECFEEEAKNYEKDYRNQLLSFSLNYINNVNKFQKENAFDNSLELSKNKLIYFYDNYNTHLYNKNIFNTLFNYYKDMENYYYLANYNLLAEACIVDIFENPKVEKINNKIIFIKTCYQLFKEQEVIDVFNSYSYHEKYAEYKNIILPDEKGKRKTKMK